MKTKIKKFLWMIFGYSALGLGTLGIFLPILPTTPFVLLAAFSFLKGSPKCYQWLINHKTFGPMVKSYIQDRAISRKTRKVALTTLWCSLILSSLMINRWYLTALLVIIGSSVSLYIIQLKTTNSPKPL